MTDKEKFYKLALNLFKSNFKSIEFYRGKIDCLSLDNLAGSQLKFYLNTGEKNSWYLEDTFYFQNDNSNLKLSVGENDPIEIDRLIQEVKSAFKSIIYLELFKGLNNE